MMRKKMLALTAAIGLGAAISSTIDAATIMPQKEVAQLFDSKAFIHNISTAATSFFDDFDEQHARHQAGYAMPGHMVFEGPRNILVAPKDDNNTSGMVLASLGLMAVIVYRRRNI